jgi:hypothetical protein
MPLRRPLEFNNVMFPSCVNDSLLTLTRTRSYIESHWVTACHQRVWGSRGQGVMMPPAVVPPKLVYETFIPLVDDMLRSLVMKNVPTWQSS